MINEINSVKLCKISRLKHAFRFLGIITSTDFFIMLARWCNLRRGRAPLEGQRGILRTRGFRYSLLLQADEIRDVNRPRGPS